MRLLSTCFCFLFIVLQGYSQKWASPSDLDKICINGELNQQVINLFNINPVGKKRKDILKMYAPYNENIKAVNSTIPYYEIALKEFPFVSVHCEMKDTMDKCLSTRFMLSFNYTKYISADDFQKLLNLFAAFDTYILKSASSISSEGVSGNSGEKLAEHSHTWKIKNVYESGDRKIFLNLELTTNNDKTAYNSIYFDCLKLGK